MAEITQSDELNHELNNRESTPSLSLKKNQFIFQRHYLGWKNSFVMQESLDELWDWFEPDPEQELPEFLTSLGWAGLQDLINVGIN